MDLVKHGVRGVVFQPDNKWQRVFFYENQKMAASVVMLSSRFLIPQLNQFTKLLCSKLLSTSTLNSNSKTGNCFYV